MGGFFLVKGEVHMNEEVNGKGENNMNGYKPLKEIEAAERLGCKVSTLRKWRLLGKGLTYRKIGRLVRYCEADVAAFLEANKQPTGGAR